MRKYILIFISFTLACFILICVGSHFFLQKNGLPPLSWEEILEDFWLILILSITAGICSVFKFYGEFDKKD